MTESTTGSPGSTYTNAAQDNAHVDAQIGVVHGDANFYQLAGATPQEKYRVGRNYLNGNMPRQAERMIRDAFMAGCDSTEVSYYWALAVLSNRSFDHLTGAEFDQLTRSFAVIGERPPDGWTDALEVVARLVASLTIQEQQLDPDPAEFNAALGRYGQLPAARREEVRRHLEMVLVGGIQDQLEAQDAAEVEQKRLGRGRGDRVWKFFEPKPLPPRLPPSVTVGAQSNDALKLVGGVALGLLCIYLAGSLLLGRSTLVFVCAILFCSAGVYLTIRFELERRVLDIRRALVQERFHGRPLYDPLSGPFRPSARSADFAADVQQRVDAYFIDRAPGGGNNVRRWNNDTAGIRSTLAREIADQYAEVNPVPRVAEVDWLIRWHVDDIKATWRNGRLGDGAERFEVPQATATASIISTISLGFGLLLLAGNMLSASVFPGLLTSLVLGTAVALVWRYGMRICEVSAAAAHREQEAQTRLSVENKAFREWWESLDKFRPTDAEIAVWLDYDKAYLKATAMKQYGLANRDLIGHVVLVEGDPLREHARVLFGPLRFGRYVVQIFLLTDVGVRQVMVDLDLASGVMSNERRSSFRYDAISSARVEEIGVRIGSGQTSPVRRTGPHPEASSGKLVLSQRFMLTLNNLQSVSVVVGNFDEGLIDRMREDPRHLLELARDTSGVTAALRILEAIAAEGSEWVRQERLRRRRRIADYQRRRGTTAALEAAPDVPVQRVGDRGAGAELE